MYLVRKLEFSTCSRAQGPCASHNSAVHFISCTVHDLKIADLCFVLWMQYNAPDDLAAGFLDSGTAPVRKHSTKALTKEKYMVFDILSFRNCLCGYDMIQVTAGFNFWARPYRKFGTVREFGYLYCDLTGRGRISGGH